MPIFHPTAPGRMLLRSGFELTRQAIRRLESIEVRSVWIGYPQLSFLLSYTSPEVLRHKAAMAVRVRHLFDDARENADATINYEPYANAVSALSEALLLDSRTAIMLDRIGAAGDEELDHAINVSYLSTLMGLKLSWYLEHQRSRIPPQRAREAVPLGVAGMLHDIGLTRMSDEARRRIRTAPDPSDPEFQKHVDLGYTMLRGRVPPTVAAAVLHHHQRYDGTGFPARTMADGRVEPVAGDKIHVHARILAAADTYDQLSRGFGLGENGESVEQPRVRVLKRMLGKGMKHWFDDTVLRGLLAVCPPYPPGEMVTLSNGMRGVVVGWDMLDPCRPAVHRFDPDDPDAFEDGPRIDLMQTPGVCIVEMGGFDVGRDNFYPESPGAFELDSVARGLHNAAEGNRLKSGLDPARSQHDPMRQAVQHSGRNRQQHRGRGAA